MHPNIQVPTEAEDAQSTRVAANSQDALLLSNAQLVEMMQAHEKHPQIIEHKNAAKLMRSSALSVRTQEQRQLYAARRASLAVDRIICSPSQTDRLSAIRWAELWGKVARLPASFRCT